MPIEAAIQYIASLCVKTGMGSLKTHLNLGGFGRLILVRVLVLRKADKTARFTTGLEEYQNQSLSYVLSLPSYGNILNCVRSKRL